MENELTVLNGGVDITVLHHDDSAEIVKVRQLPLRLMAAFAAAQGDEAKLCELYTGKEPEWIDGLVTESQEQIVEVGDKLNLPFFFRWAERRIKASQSLAPLVPKGSALAALLPPSAPAAATPRNG